MFKVISHTDTSRDIDRKTNNNYYLEYLQGIRVIIPVVVFLVQRNAQRISCISEQLGRRDFIG